MIKSDQEYKRIWDEFGNPADFTIDDMKWIDANVPSNYRDLTITLSENDQILVKDIADKRTQAAKEAGIHKNWGSVSAHDIDLEGFGAEVAFCRIFKLEPDLTIGARKGGCDTISKKGKKIDVKWTGNLDNGLLVKTSKAKGESDVYVLVIGNFPSYKVIGFISENDLFKDENIKQSKFGHFNYHLSPEQLRSF